MWGIYWGMQLDSRSQHFWQPPKQIRLVSWFGPSNDLSFSRRFYTQYNVWVNYNDLTTTSLEIMVSKGNHPQMALIQISELLQFAQNICRSYRIRPLAANASRNCYWSSSSSRAQLGCAAASFSGALCWPLCQWNSLNDVHPETHGERSWKKHVGKKKIKKYYGKNLDIFFPLFFRSQVLFSLENPGWQLKEKDYGDDLLLLTATEPGEAAMGGPTP